MLGALTHSKEVDQVAELEGMRQERRMSRGGRVGWRVGRQRLHIQCPAV